MSMIFSLRALALPLLLGGLFSSSMAGTVFEDTFGEKAPEGRSIPGNRGAWTMADGVATCTQDDATYAKNKDHGPVIWYNVPFTDGTVSFSFRPQGVKTFVFTINGAEGHLFRFVTTAEGTGVRVWEGPGGHGAKATSMLKPDEIGPPLAEGEWTPVVVEFAGEQATVSIGSGFKKTITSAALAKPKTTIGLGFSFGTLAVREVKLTVPDAAKK